MSTHQPLLATAPQERISVLDTLRGFALFGVCLVNYAMMNATHSTHDLNALTNPWLVTDPLTRYSALFIQMLGEGKFYTIFSFLFGLGFYLFMSRNAAKGLPAKKLFVRRLLFLLVFGVLHYALVWNGDILHTYAIIGFILLPFEKASKEKVKKWAIGLLIFYLITIIELTFLMDLADANGLLDTGAQVATESTNGNVNESSKDVLIYTKGTFLEAIAYRMGTEFPTTLANTLFLGSKIGGMFLLGLYAGMSNTFRNLQENLPKFKGLLLKCAPLGILLTTFVVLIQSGLILKGNLYHFSIITSAKEVSHILLALSYVSVISILFAQQKLTSFFKSLAFVGRMALTNYLIQCLIGSLVFYGHGLGLMFKINTFHGLLITLAVFTCQIFLSQLWFKKFTFGPFEYIWRKLTYGYHLGT